MFNYEEMVQPRIFSYFYIVNKQKNFNYCIYIY